MEKRKKMIYFITKSENAEIVLEEILLNLHLQDSIVFLDLDGTRILDPEYASQLKTKGEQTILQMLNQAIRSNIKFYACQMNVMSSCNIKCCDGVELAGVATFLDLAYEADAVQSY